MALQPGQKLGDHHRIIEEIGHGGMSTVYSAWDTRLEREDAIKVMRPQYADDPTFAARFKQEAQAAASLHSPHIVEIYDWNRDRGDYYIVMERLTGADLKQIIERKGAIKCDAVARIAAQVCSALSIAHANDIIHRDIKPNNIMITPDGNVKVMDFGIAKSLKADANGLTTDNSVWGTANYVSPEQVQGKELGPASDIYSLGVVMYEASTGQLPFTGDDAISVALCQINDTPVPPSEVNPDVDPELERIILRCMEKNPANRYASAGKLRSALLSYIKTRTSGNTGSSAASPTVSVDSKPTRVMPHAGRNIGVVSNGPVTGGAIDLGGGSDGDDEEEGFLSRMGPVAKVLILVLAALLVAGIGFGVAAATGVFEDPLATVPKVTGETKDVASKRINDAKLELGKVDEVWGTENDKGLVVDQAPAAGSEVEPGTKVDLKISKGEKPVEKVTVPSLIGKSADEARQALEDIGLVAKEEQAYSTSVEKDLVASQSIDANTEVEVGTTVAYVVSLGIEKVAVPDVSGMTRDKAVSTLEGQGFQVYVEEVEDEGTEGIVRNYYPEERQPRGATITVNVTKKPEIKTADVPSVTGLSEANARTMLEGAGFQVSTSEQEVSAGAGYDNGVVLTYAPTGNQPVGTTVHIVLTKVKEEEKKEETPATTTTPTTPSTPSTPGGNVAGNAV